MYKLLLNSCYSLWNYSKILMVLLFCSTAQFSQAQETVAGTITDEKGVPPLGV